MGVFIYMQEEIMWKKGYGTKQLKAVLGEQKYYRGEREAKEEG